MTVRTRDDRQVDIIEMIERLGRTVQPEPASMNVDLRLRAVLSEAIRRFAGDRYELAARMSRLLGAEVTKAQIDAWTADSKEHSHRLPAAYLPAFCAALGDWSPLRLLAETGGKTLDTDPHVNIAKQIGQLDAELEELKTRVRQKERVRRQALALWGERSGGGGA